MAFAAVPKIQSRIKKYINAFEEVAISGEHGEVGDAGYVRPLKNFPYRILVTSGSVDEILLGYPETMTPEGAEFVEVDFSTPTSRVYDRLEELSGKIVVIGNRFEAFPGQRKVPKATLTSNPEHADVLECSGYVDLVRASADDILKYAPENVVISKNCSMLLTEIVAMLQERYAVPLTPSQRAPNLWASKEAVKKAARARRESVPGLPASHSSLIVSPDVASECAEILREELVRDMPRGVEICLRDLYRYYGCRIAWSSEYPLNYVRKSIQTFRASQKREEEAGELPKVSVLTITRNRPRMFALAAFNFNMIDYPKDKLEWVIVDDSDPGLEAKRSLGALSKDQRVRYVRLELQDEQPPLNVGLKRNMACKVATGDYFVNMDDDDFLHPGSLKLRLNAMKATGASCAGSTFTLCYDALNRKLFYCMVHDVFGDPVCFPEPSMMYSRGFWEARNWDRNAAHGEGRAFLEGRDREDLVDVESLENVICITHRHNMTMNMRRLDEGTTNDPETLFGSGFARLLSAVI